VAQIFVKIYTYRNCDTCRKALKFLRARGISFEEIPIRDTPPSQAELRAMLAAHDGHIRKLFNTSGMDYKALGLSAKLPGMSPDEAIDLLGSNGNLVKRPFAIMEDVRLVGFEEAAWNTALIPTK
jgi:arsenate reductase